MLKIRVPTRVSRIVQRLRKQVNHGSTLFREALAVQRFRLDKAVRLSEKPARVALVGCGAQGRSVAQAVRLLEGWSIHSLYDIRPEAAHRLSTEYAFEASVSDSLDAFFAEAEAWDVLVLATTADSHVPLALAALKAGVRSILIEKPVATSLAEADTLIREAQQVGARVAVDHTRRWIPAGEGLRRLIRHGVIGNVRAMNLTFGRGGFAMIGSHYFDFARWIFKSDIIALRAELDAVKQPSRHGAQFVDPSGRCEARLANGVRLRFDLSEDLSLSQAFFLIVGDQGRIEVDERLGKLRLVGSGGRVWEEGYLWPEAIPLGVATALFELHAGKKPRCTLDDGRAALEAVIACHQSAQSENAWVDLPLTGEITRRSFPFA